MFKNKSEKKENHKPLPPQPHGVGEIEAAIIILNDALKTGQIVTHHRGPEYVLCAIPVTVPMSPYDDRLDHRLSHYLGYNITQIKPESIRSWDDIQAEQRKLKEERLLNAKKALAEAANTVESLSRELGITHE